MIEKPLLPVRWLYCNRFGQSSFQHSDPLGQDKILISADEKVNMIWHDHVPSDPDSARLAGSRELNQHLMHDRMCQQLFATMRVERDEVERRIV
jgi:hypothetical protein